MLLPAYFEVPLLYAFRVHGPFNRDPPVGVRECPVFAGIDAEFVQHHAERLGRSRRNDDGLPFKKDPCPDQILEMGELRAGKLYEVNASPRILDEQVLARGKGLNAFTKPVDKLIRG